MKLAKGRGHERRTGAGRHAQGRVHADRRTASASDWTVDGPHFGGWEIYHVNGSPADPDRLYASQSGGWFGQVIQRSDDGGKTWDAGRQRLRLRGRGRRPPLVRRHAAPVGVQADLAPRAVPRRPRHRVRGRRGRRALPAPPTAARSGQELTALRTHPTGPTWQPGAGGMCLHTIILDPVNKDRIYVAISAAGAFRSDDAGATWLPINKGLRSGEIPDQDAEVGHCVHRITQHPSRPDTLFMQKHWDVMRTDDAGAQLARDQRRPAVRLRLPDRGARARAGDHLRRTDQERLRALPAGGQAARLPQPHRRRRVGAADQGPAAVRLLRQRATATRWRSTRSTRAASTSAPPVARSTARPTAATRWAPIVRDLPAVLSVEVQVLP